PPPELTQSVSARRTLANAIGPQTNARIDKCRKCIRRKNIEFGEEHRTLNIERRTSNIQLSMFDVGCSMFNDVNNRCRRGGSNPYAFRHRILSPARLPIPPLLRLWRILAAPRVCSQKAPSLFVS